MTPCPICTAKHPAHEAWDLPVGHLFQPKSANVDIRDASQWETILCPYCKGTGEAPSHTPIPDTQRTPRIG